MIETAAAAASPVLSAASSPHLLPLYGALTPGYASGSSPIASTPISFSRLPGTHAARAGGGPLTYLDGAYINTVTAAPYYEVLPPSAHPASEHTSPSPAGADKSGLKVSTMTAPPTPDEHLPGTMPLQGPLGDWTPAWSSPVLGPSRGPGSSTPSSSLGGGLAHPERLRQHLMRLHQQRMEQEDPKGKGRATDHASRCTSSGTSPPSDSRALSPYMTARAAGPGDEPGWGVGRKPEGAPAHGLASPRDAWDERRAEGPSAQGEIPALPEGRGRPGRAPRLPDVVHPHVLV